MALDRKDDFQDGFVRRVGGSGAGPLRHYVPTSEGFVAAVAAGLGWGMVPESQARPLPNASMDVALYWQQWKLDSPALATLAEAVTATAAQALRG